MPTSGFRLVGNIVMENGKAVSTPSLTAIEFSANKITSGTLDNARLPTTISVENLAGNLHASNLTGKISNDRLPNDIYVGNVAAGQFLFGNGHFLTGVNVSGQTILGNGIHITNLNASELKHGIIPNERISGAYTEITDLTANTVISDNVQTSAGERYLVGDARCEIRADAVTGLVVDGDIFQYNGAMSGNGAFITSFAEKSNPNLEARLADFMNSATRVYVSASGNDADHGKSPDRAVRTIKKAAELAMPGTTIFVETGTYNEDNPIFVRRNVAILGDSLRTCLLYANNPKLDFFHLSSMCYLYGLRFMHLRSPGFCCAFPCSLAQCQLLSDKVVSGDQSNPLIVDVLYSPTEYYISDFPLTRNGSGWVVDAASSPIKATYTKTSPAEEFVVWETEPNAPLAVNPNPSWNIYDKNPATRYESQISYESVDGLLDAAGVSIVIELPTPQRFVAYTMTGANLSKWRLEAKETNNASWTIIHQGSGNSNDTFRTAATLAYSYYRFVLLQNSVPEGSSPFVIGSVDFKEATFPTVLVDAPPIQNTIVGDFEIVEGGSGYQASQPPTILIENPEGVNAEPGFVSAQAKPIIADGKITGIQLDKTVTTSVQSLTLGAAGSGYVTTPTITFTSQGGNPGSGATARATINKNGTIRSVHLISKGSGYTQAPTVSITGGGGSGGTATCSLLGRDTYGSKYSGTAVVKILGGAPGGSGAVATVNMTDDYAEMEVPEFDPSNATVLNLDASGRIQKLVITNQGGGYVDVPTISIHAPERLRPFITGSPYVQNCSNISGPWDQFGERVLETHRLPFDIEDIYNAAGGQDGGKGVRKIDGNGSGGGIRIDGAACHPLSPLRSVVVDAFTQVNQGGIGFLLINLAYAQFVSTFGTFCGIHMMALGGSFANASNSVTDFGIRGLVAQGYYRTPYLKAEPVPMGGPNGQYVVGKGYRSSLVEIKLTKAGIGYETGSTVGVTIDPPSASATTGEIPATATVKVADDGSLEEIVFTNIGKGYRSTPTVTIDSPQGWSALTGDTQAKARATAEIRLGQVSVIRVAITDFSARPNNTKPDILSIARIHGQWYTITGSTEARTEAGAIIPLQYDLTFQGDGGVPSFVDEGHGIDIFQVSYISTGGHVFEYCGSADARGATYNALPEYGGNPVSGNEIVATYPARIFYTSADHRGDLKIGRFFAVEQSTGKVRIDTNQFDLSGLESIGPFRRNGVYQGVEIKEASSNPLLVASVGIPDPTTVPTQTAVKSYVDARAVPGGGNSGEFLRKLEGNQGYGWVPFTAENLGVISVVARADVISGLIADGDAKIYGDLTCEYLKATGLEIKPPVGSVGDPREPGTITFELLNNTTLGIKAMGSDGVIRTGTLALS